MKILITYDINLRHDDVKNALIEVGFRDYWVIKDGETQYLPDTTLWHQNLIGPAEAKRLFSNIIIELNLGQPPHNIITVSHFVAVEMGEKISGMEGEPHS